MTTIRELCEYPNIPTFAKDFFRMNRGKVPLCCFETKRENSEWLITCSWLKEWYNYSDFKKKCLKCQEEIQKILGEKELES